MTHWLHLTLVPHSMKITAQQLHVLVQVWGRLHSSGHTQCKRRCSDVCACWRCPALFCAGLPSLPAQRQLLGGYPAGGQSACPCKPTAWTEQAPDRGCMQLRVHLCCMWLQPLHSIFRPAKMLLSSSVKLHGKGVLLLPHVLTETVDCLCAPAHWQLLRNTAWLPMWVQQPLSCEGDASSAPACILSREPLCDISCHNFGPAGACAAVPQPLAAADGLPAAAGGSSATSLQQPCPAVS